MPVDLLEGFHLQQGADAYVLGVSLMRLVEPRVDVLALRRAGFQGLRDAGVRMLPQVRHDPELQRMHPREVAAVPQRIAVGPVALVERRGLLCPQP